MNPVQQRLFPDPRPLVDRLGSDFFRTIPDRPGVYVMKDASRTPVYVGKARSLRRRLRSYRVANPDRLPQRHLRLLRCAVEIELIECPDEAAALAQEAELLRTLRPRFNRAGTWPSKPRFFAWRTVGPVLEIAVVEPLPPESLWQFRGSFGRGAFEIRRLLLRSAWIAFHPRTGYSDMPQGWFRGIVPDPVALTTPDDQQAQLLEIRLGRWLDGDAGLLADWLRVAAANCPTAFDRNLLLADLERIVEFAAHITGKRQPVSA